MLPARSSASSPSGGIEGDGDTRQPAPIAARRDARRACRGEAGTLPPDHGLRDLELGVLLPGRRCRASAPDAGRLRSPRPEAHARAPRAQAAIVILTRGAPAAR